MSISFQYRTICEMTFRHAYLLNNGVSEFDAFEDEEDKKAALKRVRFDDSFSLVPLGETLENIKNHRMVLIASQHGFRITTRVESDASDPVVVPNNDLRFVFALQSKDPNFQQYTSPDKPSTSCYLFANTLPTNLVKEEKDEFTKETTVTADELVGNPSLLPFIDELIQVDEDFILSEADTLRMKNNFLGQQDPGNIIGFIYLQIESTDDDKSLLIDFSDEEAEPPHFKVHFSNKETFWKYKKTSASFEAETNTKKPLTKYGYIEIKPDVDFTPGFSSGDLPFKYHYPNPVPGNIEASGSDPEKIYSVIFI